MTQTHPLTPPDELLEHWRVVFNLGNLQNALTLAYRAGADQELEACCKWLEWQKLVSHQNLTAYLRATRRPKPPSLKEQALHELNDVYNRDKIDDSTYDTIRRALEQL